MGNCMPSKWYKKTNSKIQHLKFFRFFQTSDKNYWKNCFLGNFLFLSLPLSPMLGKNKQNLCQAMLWVRNIVLGEKKDFWTHFLKFPYYFATCSLFLIQPRACGLAVLLKWDSNVGFCIIVESIYFEEHLPATASASPNFDISLG